MKHVLSRLLNIRPTEWPRLIILCAMLFVTNTGLIWGKIVIESTFLQQLGVKALPGVLMLGAIISILGIALYTPFADRVANDKLLIAICLITAVGVGLGLVFLGQGWGGLAYPLLYLLFLIFLDMFNLHWETFINGFYDTRSAKRIIPVAAAADRVAAIIAGLSLPLLRAFLAPAYIIGLWLGSLFIVALLVQAMPRLLKEKKAAGAPAPSPDQAHASYLENIRQGYHYVTRSAYLRWMALSTLLIYLLFALLNYQTGAVLLQQFPTEKEMTTFLALVNSGANLLMLPILLFGLSRFIGRVGLGNSSLVFPTGTLAIVAGLIFRENQLTAALAYADRTAFRSSIRGPIDSLLYNAVPLRFKGRARAFIGGFVLPLGTLLGGMLLLLVDRLPLAWLLSGLMLSVAAAYLLVTLIIRKQYGQALIRMLEEEDFSTLMSQEASNLSVADPATLRALQKKLEDSPSPEFTLFIAQLITRIGGSETVSILGQVARQTAEARTRAAILEVLAAADTRTEAARQLYVSFLADPDGRVRQAAFTGLEQLAELHQSEFQRLALALVQDPELEVRVRVLTTLARSDDFYRLALAVAALDQLLADPADPHRAAGVRVLGQVKEAGAGQRLVPFLADPADEVRLETALALETSSRQDGAGLAANLTPAQVSRLLQDPVQRIRQAGLTLLGRIGTPESHQVLVSALTDTSPEIRATAAETLVQVGKAAIATVHPSLDSPDPQLRKMAGVILSRINRRDFGPLVETHITGNLLAIYRNYNRLAALQPHGHYPGLAVLQDALREQNQLLTAEIFYLLTALHEPEAIQVIDESLRSTVGRVRINAVEALESLAGVQTAQLIGPLFEPDQDLARLLSLSREAWDMPALDFKTVVSQLTTDGGQPWLHAIIIYALGELGAEARSRERLEVKAKTGRRRPADPLGALLEPEENVAATAQPVPTSGEERQTPLPLSLAEIEALVDGGFRDHLLEVRLAARAARRLLAGQRITGQKPEEAVVLSTIEKIIFLKEVPFFQGMTIDQLRVLAEVCEEELFETDGTIFRQNEPGGALYVVVSGRVGIEQEKRKGSYVRLATIEARAYFGEMSLFDGSPRSANALALQDTMTLKLRRDPLIALARQYPDLSLQLINVLSQRLREANLRIADLTRTRPRELQKLFDELG